MDSAKLTEETFLRILDILKQGYLYQRSPKFFVIYAHENDKLGIKAHQKLVVDYISWFKELGFNINSDKSPYGYWPAHSSGREGQSIPGASTDVIQNQLCLLPQGWHHGTVDYVLVFQSELLTRYIQDERDCKIGERTYSEAIFDACNRYSQKSNPVRWDKVCQAVRDTQQTYSSAMGTQFHHVLTELALLGFRNSMGVKSAIPILLFDNDEEEPEWKSLLELVHMKEEEHRLFFKILPAIEKLEECFKKLKDFLENGNMKPEQYRTQREVEIFQVLQSLNAARDLWNMERPITRGTIRETLNLHCEIDRASIKRVSGTKLLTSLNDISLAVAERSSSKEKKYEERQIVPMHDLFNEIELEIGRKIRPKRVFIQGRPGVGKTTLCRRMMYDYCWDRNLREKFDLVVRVPMRKLEQFENLTDLLYNEYFQLTPRGDELAKYLNEIILKQSASNEESNVKLLLILDGLDEARQWSPEKLEKLMNRHLVLITSRSYGNDISSVNLHLEALGLNKESIEAYVGNTEIVSSHVGKAILRFIQNKVSIRDMLRVPILLDILCYSWDELQRQNVTSIATEDAKGHDLPTITSLYQAVIRTLWRKDIPRLGKADHGELVTAEIVNSVRDAARIERVVRAESNLIGEISIIMMESAQVELSEEVISETIQRLEMAGIELPLSLEQNIPKLSFIRLEHRSQRRQISFIHLTFQEFFAAQWLSEHPTQLKEYVQKYKYNHRFENVWRFVAGLFQINANDEGKQLNSFFNILEEEPRDLLGPAHQRLIMRCLNEVLPSKKTELSSPNMASNRYRSSSGAPTQMVARARPEWKNDFRVFYVDVSETNAAEHTGPRCGLA
ncbi:hypothetical protein F5Y14DRAFT_465111 [Nemania sp. NC0429]|nr:hypothetical protein F5Y14DRAFT_465111 [Nemania sp. NC0429]